MLSSDLRFVASNAQFPSQGNSSTGYHGQRICGGANVPLRRASKAVQVREVSYLSGHCGLAAKTGPSHLAGERNESAFDRWTGIHSPNRKDRQKADRFPLLKTPNRPPMTAFTEGKSQRSSTPAGQVMDRSTEGAAGGSDAV